MMPATGLEFANMPVVHTRMGYLANDDVYKKEKPFFSNIPFYHIPGAKQTNIVTAFHDNVPILDLRRNEKAVSLDTHGFELHSRPSSDVPSEEKFRDEEWIKRDYYAEIGYFVKQELGASRVNVFDHTVRRVDPNLPIFARGGIGNRQPSKMAHVDQTAQAGVNRVRFHMKEEAEELLKGRYQIINVWHPLFNAIQTWPLALCDYSSVDQDNDLHASDLVFPHYTGEQWLVSYNEKHVWYFLRDQKPEECWFFKCCESESGKAKFAVHSSFDIPAPEGTPQPRPRESVEFRCLVFYDKD